MQGSFAGVVTMRLVYTKHLVCQGRWTRFQCVLPGPIFAGAGVTVQPSVDAVSRRVVSQILGLYLG